MENGWTKEVNMTKKKESVIEAVTIKCPHCKEVVEITEGLIDYFEPCRGFIPIYLEDGEIRLDWNNLELDEVCFVYECPECCETIANNSEDLEMLAKKYKKSLTKKKKKRKEIKMKVIALDMDGVVNSKKKITEWLDAKKNHFASLGSSAAEAEDKTRKAYIEEFQNMTELVFPEYAVRVSKIVDETGAKILWSSTWRNIDKYKDLEVAKDMFNRRGLPGEALLDRTPDFLADFRHDCYRGSEISLWLKEHPEVTKCAVIDDREDAGYGLPSNAQYFATTWQSGLTDEVTDAIIKYLKED